MMLDIVTFKWLIFYTAGKVGYWFSSRRRLWWFILFIDIVGANMNGTVSAFSERRFNVVFRTLNPTEGSLSDLTDIFFFFFFLTFPIHLRLSPHRQPKQLFDFFVFIQLVYIIYRLYDWIICCLFGYCGWCSFISYLANSLGGIRCICGILVVLPNLCYFVIFLCFVGLVNLWIWFCYVAAMRYIA